MRRTREEAEATRREILDAALRLFSEQGYAATRLNDIAEAAGVTRGAIYHHFDSKAGLYQQLLESFAGLFDREVASAIKAGGTFLEICRRVMIRPLAALEADPRAAAFYELAQFQTVSEPELQAIHARQLEGADTMFEQIAGYFRMGMENNDIRADRSPVELARAFVALQNGLIHLWLQRKRAFSLVETAGTAAEIFAAGLVNEAV